MITFTSTYLCNVIIYRYVINFEINLSFLIMPFFYNLKSQDKNVNISGAKRAFNME